MNKITISEIVKGTNPNETFRVDRKTIKRLYENIQRKEEKIRALEAKIAWLELNQTPDKFVVYG